MTLTLTRPCSNLVTAHRLIILDICAKLFENPKRGSKDIERTRKCDGRTDGRTDRQRSLKQYVSPFHGGDIIKLGFDISEQNIKFGVNRPIVSKF